MLDNALYSEIRNWRIIINREREREHMIFLFIYFYYLLSVRITERADTSDCSCRSAVA